MMGLDRIHILLKQPLRVQCMPEASLPGSHAGGWGGGGGAVKFEGGEG